MLAKIWKKLLLTICIIACLFNVTAKLVNRHSLEDNLKKANDGETVFDFTKKDDSEETNTVNDVDGNTVVADNEAESLDSTGNTVETTSGESSGQTGFEAKSIYDSVSSFFNFDNLF